MTVWHEEELATLHLGDCLEVLAAMEPDNIDLAVKVAERSGMAAPAGEHDGMIVSTLFGET